MSKLSSLKDLNDDVLHIIFAFAVKPCVFKKDAIALACTSRRMNAVG